MTSKGVEIGVGLFVALGLAALLMLAMKVSNLSESSVNDGYELTARFDNIGGLKVRSPVTMAGVRIGRVSEIGFDSRTYEAVVDLTIDSKYDQLPDDTSASIFTAGRLRDQYVGLEAGGSLQFLGDKDEIKLTQSAVVLEQIIGQFLYNRAAQGGGS
jgi:phospholipid/cholesterol/gamma-HCH transport system substrate-binding protein